MNIIITWLIVLTTFAGLLYMIYLGFMYVRKHSIALYERAEAFVRRIDIKVKLKENK